MTDKARFTHILDDRALGGVTRALENFEHPEITAIGAQDIVDFQSGSWKPRRQRSVGIIHFTANWRKLSALFALRNSRSFSSLILIEHSYTRGFEHNCVNEQKRFRFMLRLAYRLVDKVVAVSHDQRHWMLEAKLAPAEKIVAIPQARDCNSLLNIPLAQRASGPLRIGAYGRFHEQKGFDLLLQAMATIPEHIAELTIAGYGDNEAALKKQAIMLPNVCIEPAFENPEDFLSRVDLVVIPSRWEAFGLVAAEARAAGRPIIAAAIDGLNDQIGMHSWSYEANDVEALARTIREAAEAEDLNKRGLAARQHVSGEFNSMLKGWANLQLEVANAHLT